MSKFTTSWLVQSWLSISLGLICSSATGQTATDLDCAQCVDDGEIGLGAVAWPQLGNQLQQGLADQRNDIGDLENRVLALEAAATSSGMTVLANGQPIGKLISVHYVANTAPGRSPNVSFADSVTLLTLEGYPVTIRLSGELVSPDRIAINYLEPNCAGQPYIGLGAGPGWVPDLGMVTTALPSAQLGSVVYVPKGSEVVPSHAFEPVVVSRFILGPCRVANPDSESAYFAQMPLFPNDESITGVPNAGTYPAPIPLHP